MRMQRRSCGIRLKQSSDHRTANANCPVAAWHEQRISNIHAHHSMEAPSQVRHRAGNPELTVGNGVLLHRGSVEQASSFQGRSFKPPALRR